MITQTAKSETEVNQVTEGQGMRFNKTRSGKGSSVDGDCRQANPVGCRCRRSRERVDEFESEGEILRKFIPYWINEKIIQINGTKEHSKSKNTMQKKDNITSSTRARNICRYIRKSYIMMVVNNTHPEHELLQDSIMDIGMIRGL